MRPFAPRKLSLAVLVPALCLASGCKSTATTSGGGGTTSSTSTSSTTMATASTATGGSCTLTANTTDSAVTSPSGCAVLVRDTTACQAARQASGLSGFWLNFSCRVTLTATQGANASVTATADGQPDYRSNYFASTDPCHVAYTGGIQNPNNIAAEMYSIGFPLTPNPTSQTMMGAVVGLAVNGVPIFGNFAAPGDDIYKEASTFDACGGHPQMSGAYHYHTEPYSISYDDDHFIGVMRDGYPIYGRRDPDGSMPTVDANGGHTGVTIDSPSTPVYHYHVNQQTSTNPQSAGQMQWFLTTGTYHGTPAACSTCN